MSAPLESWLLGDPGLLPFAGHFRLRVEGAQAAVALSGRIAGDCDPAQAFAVSRRVAAVLSTAADGPWHDTDRHGLLRRIWQLLDALDEGTLGPARGDDLSLLLLARDPKGVGVAGVGLSGAWVQLEAWRALVPPGHPLLARPGRPSSLPGVLTLDHPCTRVVAAPRHLDPVLPSPDAIARRCGAGRDPDDGAPR